MNSNSGSRYCAVCGKDMQVVINGAETNSVGMQIVIGFDEKILESEKLYEQFGPYADLMKREGTINICWACYLRSLGVQPEKLSKHPLSNS